MNVNEAHETYIRSHLGKRSGERRGRLVRGHGHGEVLFAKLHAMGYQVISFAYDDIEQRSELCISLLRMVLARYQASKTPVQRARLAEKEVLRLAVQIAEPIRPKDVEQHFDIDHRTAVMILKKLCSKGLLMPSFRGKGKRIVKYALAGESLLENID